MHANRTAGLHALVDTLVERSITESVAEFGDGAVSSNRLTAHASRRYDELTEPLRSGYDAFFANTVTTTLIEVAERDVLSNGGDAFSVEKVVDQSMKKLERVLGAPRDAAGARAAIRAYLDEAHGR